VNNMGRTAMSDDVKARASKMYFQQGLKKSLIANRLGYSRSTITILIKELIEKRELEIKQ